jgi:hypothetical protein
VKNKWTKPILATIIRHKPEEAVLDYCNLAFSGGGLDAAAGGCRRISMCSNCPTVGTIS